METKTSVNKSDLYSGEKVSRTSLRIDVLGDIDELNSILGIARCHIQNKEIQQKIFSLQKKLIIVSSELATTKKKLTTLPSRIDEPMLNMLLKEIEALRITTKSPTTFVIPGENLASAYLHQTRTVVRRCERKVTELFEYNEIINKTILQWFNRVGAYLFLLALSEEQN